MRGGRERERGCAEGRATALLSTPHTAKTTQRTRAPPLTQGTPFFFDGYADATFALLSERDHQVNAKFGSVGPKHGVDSTIWMTGFGILHASGLELSIEIETNHVHIKLVHDAGELEGGPCVSGEGLRERWVARRVSSRSSKHLALRSARRPA